MNYKLNLIVILVSLIPLLLIGIVIFVPNTLTDIPDSYALILAGLSIDIVGAFLVILPEKIIEILFQLTNNKKIEISQDKQKQFTDELGSILKKAGVIILIVGFLFQIAGNYLQAIS